MSSANKFPNVVTSYIEEEQSADRMTLANPIHPASSYLHTSPFGVIPKKASKENGDSLPTSPPLKAIL